MFVSKAAVVGGGTMGGEIAQAIAAADIPVVVKDVDQKFVDAALEKARAVTEGQLARLVKKEKLTQEQADARLAEVMGRITGATTYEGFGDVDFVVEAVPEKMAIKQAVFRELDAGHPRPRDPRLQHLGALDHRDRRIDPARRQGRRLPLLLPGLGDAAGRGDRRRGDLAGNGHRRLQLRPGDQEAADRLRRGPRLRRQPHPDGDDRRDLARAGGARPLAEGDRRGDRRRPGGADGPVLPHRPARPRHRPARRRAPPGGLRRDLLRPRGAAEAGRRRQARRQERRRGLLQGRRADGPRRGRARRRGTGRDVHLPRPDRGLPAGRGGRSPRSATSTSG